MSALAPHRPIVAADRVSDVLARDESLVEVFVRLAPHFAKLRHRAMRRVMARLVTVEQAARMAGVRPEVLIRDLNVALAAAPGQKAIALATSPESHDIAGQSWLDDERIVHPPRAPVVDLDVRDDLRAGREPFSRIMAAMSALAAGEVLQLRTLFEPVPLYTVLGKRGCLHEAQRHSSDDWSVWFWRPAGDAARGTATGLPLADAGGPPIAPDLHAASAPNVVWLDVRGLEPPEPLLRTLAALESLPEGHALIQVNARVPQFLLPILAERGFACEVDDSRPDRVLVRIWRPT